MVQVSTVVGTSEPGPIPLVDPVDVRVAVEPEKPFTQVSFKLKDGKTITLGPPPVSVDLLASQFVEGMNDGTEITKSDQLQLVLQLPTIESILYVREIDGSPVMVPQRKLDFAMLQGRLGDRAIKQVRTIYQKYFAADEPDELSIQKK